MFQLELEKNKSTAPGHLVEGEHDDSEGGTVSGNSCVQCS